MEIRFFNEAALVTLYSPKLHWSFHLGVYYWAQVWGYTQRTRRPDKKKLTFKSFGLGPIFLLNFITKR